MKLIVGLGNPGAEYDKTRHNAGFMVVDRLVNRHAPGAIARSRFQSAAFDAAFGGEKVLLLKPTTYMNRSGQSVGEAVRFFKLDPAEDLLVITDDVALPVGSIRVRASGGTAGHNGLKDIERALGGGNYPRLRVGVGAVPAMMRMEDWVLGRFTDGEKGDLDRSIDRGADACEAVVAEGVEAAMNRFNEKVKHERPASHPADDRVEGGADGVHPGWTS